METDRTGEWLKEHEEYLNGDLSYDELQRRNAERYRNSPHDSLGCDPKTLQCVVGLRKALLKYRRALVLSIILDVLAVGGGTVLAVALLVESQIFLGIVWIVLTIGNVYSLTRFIQEFRECRCTKEKKL